MDKIRAPRWFVAVHVSLVAAACAGSAAPSGAAPPPAGALTQTLTWHQDPGSEILQCRTFKLDNDDPIEISRIQFQFGHGSHHVHIYRADTPEADGVQDCWGGIAWPHWRLLAGAQTQPLDWQLPDGLTLPLDPHQQLLVQVHWLNGSAAPVDPKIDLTFTTAATSAGHVGVTFGVNKQVAMRPGQSKTVRHFCPLPAGSSLIAMMGHFHALGRAYSVEMRAPADASGTGTIIYDGQDENTLVFKSYLPPLAVPPGDGLDFTCQFSNFRDFAIDWGADTARQEHCNMAAYYFPADDAADFCIKELDDVPPLASVTATSAAVRAGEATTITVRTATPVETDTDVTIGNADASVLGAPGLVTIPAGASEASFTVRGLRPANATALTATLGGSAQSIGVSVGGLLISEILAAPSAREGGQWIEIANASGVPIDLSGYTIGAGRMRWDELTVPLGSVLAPHGCLVLSAPAALPVMLPSGMDQPGGVALFDGQAPAPLDALPLDALVYGSGNPGGLVDPTGGRAAAVPAPGVGSSLGRMSDGRWYAQLVPSPDICEVGP